MRAGGKKRGNPGQGSVAARKETRWTEGIEAAVERQASLGGGDKGVWVKAADSSTSVCRSWKLGRCIKAAHHDGVVHGSAKEAKTIKCTSARGPGDVGYKKCINGRAHPLNECSFTAGTCPYAKHDGKRLFEKRLAFAEAWSTKLLRREFDPPDLAEVQVKRLVDVVAVVSLL